MTAVEAPPTDATVESETLESLRARASSLEDQVRSLSEQARKNLILAELKTEAVRAGMVDFDGLKLLDASTLTVTEQGEVFGTAALMDRFRRQKPWLFGSSSSTTTAVPPPQHPPRAKQATDMTPEEYRAARAAILRRT
jgi:hypothetical protein